MCVELSTKSKGNLTELQCITAFYKLGYNVSIPYGENSRYDFIADIDGILIRVQVKTSRIKKGVDGAIGFSTTSTHVNSSRNKIAVYTNDDIDFFATFWDEQCYLVPVGCEPLKHITLGLNKAKNGQKSCINFAEDYTIEKQIDLIK